MKSVQRNLKMKNLRHVPVQSTIFDFINNLTNFEDMVQNVWQHELISSFNMNRPLSPRWRYSIGLLWGLTGRTHHQQHVAVLSLKDMVKTLSFFYSEPTFQRTPRRKMVYLRRSNQMMTHRFSGSSQLRGTVNISLAWTRLIGHQQLQSICPHQMTKCNKMN